MPDFEGDFTQSAHGGILLQDILMARVVARMSVISDAPAASQGDRIHGGERNQAPRGPRVSLAEEHALAYRRANGPLARRKVLGEAIQALREATLSCHQKQLYTPGTIEWRAAIARSPGTLGDVAYKFGVSRSTVSDCRKRFRPVAPVMCSAQASLG